MEENRRFMYKQTATPEKIRDRSRETFSDIRKDKREKLLSTKRFRNESSHLASHEYNSQQIKLYTKLIQKRSDETQEQLKYLRAAFSYTCDFVDNFFEVPNSLHTLVGYLTGKDSELQLEAAWCITNIVANDHKHMMTVVKASAPYFITYLQGGSSILQDQSSWALGNMAAENDEIRDILKAQGVLQPLISLVKSDIAAVVQSSLFALCNMSRSRDSVIPVIMTSEFPKEALNRLSNENTDLNIIGELAWLISYITTMEEHCVEFAKNDILKFTVHWLCKVRPHQQEYLFAVTPLLRCLGNIVGCEDHAFVETVVTSGNLLQTLNNFLVSNKRHLIKECLWVLSNIWINNNKLKDYIEDIKLIIPNLTRHLSSAYEIKKEASICMCNLLHGDESLTDLIATKENLILFIDILKLPDVDLINKALEFFLLTLSRSKDGKDTFLKLDGPSYLEALEFNDTEEIRNKAIYLLETFYETDDE